MPRFFTETISESAGTITGDDAKHISRVLRMKIGDSLTVCDTKGSDYDCMIESVSDQQVALKVLRVYQSESEPSVKVHLYQAMPKGDKLELIIQKAVELGVDSVTPIMTKRCVSKPDPKSMTKKLERYNRIALEAAKQSGRGKVPKVLPMLEYKEALSEIQKSSCPILFYENATAPAKEVIAQGNQKHDISVLIGSEGGFEEEEVALAKQSGCHVLSLGKRILRCETAPLAALAIIMFETGNMQ